MPPTTQDYRELVRLAQAEQGKLSSSAWFVTGEDHLRVRSFNFNSSAVVTVEGRFLDADGRVQPFAHIHRPNTDRTQATTLHALGEGFLLNLAVRASSGTPRRGQCFVIVELVRGISGAVLPLATIVQGFVTDTARLAWPGSPIIHSAEGPGIIRSLTGTNPAAGAESSETVPTNARWRLLAWFARLVTAVAAANREVTLVIDDGALTCCQIPIGTAQTASLTRDYHFATHNQRNTIAQAAVLTAPLPDVLLEDGFRVRTVTSNLQAADDYGAPQLLVEEWIED